MFPHASPEAFGLFSWLLTHHLSVSLCLLATSAAETGRAHDAGLWADQHGALEKRKNAGRVEHARSRESRERVNPRFPWRFVSWDSFFDLNSWASSFEFPLDVSAGPGCTLLHIPLFRIFGESLTGSSQHGRITSCWGPVFQTLTFLGATCPTGGQFAMRLAELGALRDGPAG